jgi:hypothetical protein
LFELGVALGTGKLLIPIIPADLEGSSIPFGLRNRRYLTKGAPDEAADAITNLVYQGLARKGVRKVTVDASVHRLEQAVQRLEGLSEPRRRPRNGRRT